MNGSEELAGHGWELPAFHWSHWNQRGGHGVHVSGVPGGTAPALSANDNSPRQRMKLQRSETHTHTDETRAHTLPEKTGINIRPWRSDSCPTERRRSTSSLGSGVSSSIHKWIFLGGRSSTRVHIKQTGGSGGKNSKIAVGVSRPRSFFILRAAGRHLATEAAN